jgi:trk system potassium uptake protein TrkA
MRIIVGGAGEVGFHIARVLRSEGHDLFILEKDRDMVRRAKSIDALVIEGNAASPSDLEKAGISNADLYIAVTGSDEVNLLSCSIAASRLIPTIARVNNFSFVRKDSRDVFERIGIKNIFCPDLVSAGTIIKLIGTPSVVDARPIIGGDAYVLVLRLSKKSSMVDRTIGSIDIPSEAKIIGIYEDRSMILPRPNYTLKARQRVVVLINDMSVLPRLETLFARRSLGKVKTVFVSGANDIGTHIARIMEKKLGVILMDESKELCEEAARALEKTYPYVADPTNSRELEDAGIKSADVFIAAGEDEERNALSCFLAKKLGARRTMAIIDNPDLADIASNMGVDIVVNRRWATIGEILEQVHEAEYNAVLLMDRDDAQLLEIEVGSNSSAVGRAVNAINMRGEAEIAAIRRKGLAEDGTTVRKVKVARDNDLLMAGDQLIVFAMREAIPRIKRVLK